MQCSGPGFKVAWHCKFQHALPLSHIRPSHTMQQENQYRGSFWDTPGRISAVFWISKIKLRAPLGKIEGCLFLATINPSGGCICHQSLWDGGGGALCPPGLEEMEMEVVEEEVVEHSVSTLTGSICFVSCRTSEVSWTSWKEVDTDSPLDRF